MRELRHNIENKIWFFSWYKWASLLLLIALLFCFFFKRCSDPASNGNPNVDGTQDTISQINSNRNINHYPDGIYPLPLNNHSKKPITPDRIETDPDDPLNRDFVNDLVNVYLKDTVNIERFSQAAQTAMQNLVLIPVDTAETYKRIQFEVPKDQREQIITRFRQDSLNVKYATKEWVFRTPQANSTVSDPGFSNDQNSWFYKTIGVFDAWKYTKGDNSVKIAVLDDGFDLSHKELASKYSSPWNVITYSANITFNSTNQFHGTHVAGTIVAESNNNFGISGVAPDCTFIPVQVSDASGYITFSSVLDGVFYALKNEARVINLSLAMSIGNMASIMDNDAQLEIRNKYLKDEEKLWEEVFEIAKEFNTIIVQAAGNDSILSGVDPMKRNSNCLVVGAIDRNRNLTNFTNFGDDVDVFVPGQEIYSTLPGNEMGCLNGTSMASPIVAGAVGLIVSHNPDLTAEQVITIIKAASDENKILDLTKIFRG